MVYDSANGVRARYQRPLACSIAVLRILIVPIVMSRLL